MTDRRRTGGRRRPRIDAPRVAAHEVLTAVREADAYTNLVLPAVLGRRQLTGRDAAFTTELASGTIRWQGAYDAILAACLDRPVARLDAGVHDVLRLGAHQLLAMRVPDHAAISSSVELTRARVGPGPSGLVNAVLRKVARRSRDEWLAEVAPGGGRDALAVRTSHPGWVVDLLGEAWRGNGGDDADLEQVLAADNVAPSVTLVARPGLCSVAELESAGAGPLPWSPWAVALPSGDPGQIPAVAEGRAAVQDEGSQLVAAALAGAMLGGRDQDWLDLCAGPGGKAGLLAALAAQRGARLLAVERQPHRAGLVRSAVRAVPGGVRGVVTADGTRPAWRDGTFDRVLVDAPCSGLGALRRRPEARWRRRPDDLPGLVELQTELLRRGLDALRPGGLLLYATCSPVLAETVGIVDAVLGERAGVRLEDLTGNPALAALHRPEAPPSTGPRAGTVQLWPHLHGTDAMFLALLRRTGEK